MKKIIVFLTVVLFAVQLYGQFSTDTVKRKNNVIVKFALLSYFDMTPSYQFAVEYKIDKQFSLQHEVGYITNYVFPLFRKETVELSGFRTRNEIRYYLIDLDGYPGMYTSGEILYSRFHDIETKQYSMNGGLYNQLFDITRHFEMIAVHQKIGWQLFYKPKGRLMVDIYMGLGLRKVNFYEDDVPANASEVWTGNSFNMYTSDRQQIYPSLSFGYKIGYVIK